MQHIYMESTAADKPTLLLLHGTGGNERDLLPVADVICPEAARLGVRGSVLENGMPRFFRRLAEGVFDEEDLVKRTHELDAFVTESVARYSLDRDRLVAVGYSNGANIAASLLYHIPGALKHAILFHAMPPRYGLTLPDLTGVNVFLGAGRRDSLITPEQTLQLASDLREAGAEVTEFWTDGGHQLSRQEVEEAARWLQVGLGL